MPEDESKYRMKSGTKGAEALQCTLLIGTNRLGKSFGKLEDLGAACRRLLPRITFLETSLGAKRGSGLV